MKRFLRYTLAAALCFGIFTQGFPAMAVVDNPTTNEELFSAAVGADGEDSELISYRLYQNFKTDPEAFLTELNACSESIQQTVSDFLTQEAYWSEDESAYRQALSTVSDTAFAAQLSTQFDEYAAAQQKLTDGTPEEHALPDFDPETVKTFIDSSLLASNPYDDEEFCIKAAEWYAADPALFAEILVDYDRQEIARLANQIAFAVAENKVAQPQVMDTELDADAAQVLTQLQEGIASGLEARPFRCSIQTADTLLPRSTQVPTIGSILYHSGTEVGSTPVTVTISESSATSVTRTYFLEIYQIRNGVEYKKTSGSMSISAGSRSATKTFAMTTYETGVLYTKVKVYSSNGGSLLASRTGQSADTFTGTWRIQIDLYTSRNRQGDLGLYNASGDLQLHAVCLGRSASNASESVTNGNTPRGNYTGYLDGPKPTSEQAAYGPYKYVRLTPKFSTTRSGFLIHGGRSQTTLTPTNGCVRVFNADQKKIQDTLTTLVNSKYHHTVGNVNVKVI